jgi:hypothetical protein
MEKRTFIMRVDKTPPTTPKGNECKCPQCGNSFYISGGKCYSCGHNEKL